VRYDIHKHFNDDSGRLSNSVGTFGASVSVDNNHSTIMDRKIEEEETYKTYLFSILDYIV